jgi:RimJ/RimL family protein N-acetyltransferase
VLRDQEIILRPFEPTDAETLYEATLESLADLCAWMNWCRHDYSLAHCRQFLAEATAQWERGDTYNFAVLDSSKKTLCGSIGLNRIDYAAGSANVGYWVRRSQSGRGIASKALHLAGRFAFDELRLERVEIVVPQGNLASRRVAEKAGARLEMGLPKNVLLNDQSREARVYWLAPACIQ